jgi:hypothetical protein
MELNDRLAAVAPFASAGPVEESIAGTVKAACASTRRKGHSGRVNASLLQTQTSETRTLAKQIPPTGIGAD